MAEEREATVAQVGDLQDGRMKAVKVGQTEVLLARVGGQFHAVGATCTHYGAPLAEGVLHGERLVCPWHHACFSAVTGDLQEPPALDALPRYAVRLEGEAVIVSVPAEPSDRRRMPTTPRDPQDTRLFAILGGGAAGNAAVEELRQAGYTGRIALITREHLLPYDRVNVSKEYLQGTAEAAWMPLRPDEFYEEQGVEVLRDTSVIDVDVAARAITFADGSGLGYDALLLASGGRPNPGPVPGADLGNVCALRSQDDADRIIAAAQGATRAVVIGASFIGMEAASSLRQRGLEVTVVAPEDVPFGAILGPQVGRMFLELHQEHGVAFRLGQQVRTLDGQGAVAWVTLESGERLPADLVLLGLGVTPDTGYLRGLPTREDGGVLVDEFLQAGDAIWAAGDIAAFPLYSTGETVRVEHWRLAQQQGRVAARNMLGQGRPYDGVPYFWTQHFGKALRYVGRAANWDDVLFWGSVESRDFLAFYLQDGEVVAAAGSEREKPIAALEELMRTGRTPGVMELRAGPIDLEVLLRRV